MTLKRFFCRRTSRLGKLETVTRAGWLATSGVQYASMFSLIFLELFAVPFKGGFGEDLRLPSRAVQGTMP